MEATSRVFILGASGTVGSATVRELVQKGVPVTAGVRDVAKARLQFGDLPGLSFVQADMAGSESALASALAGVKTLFIVTPGAENRAALVARAIKLAKTAGVGFALIVSVPTVGTDSVFGRQFAEIESAVKASGLSSCVVRLPLFLDNHLFSASSIKSERAFYGPINPYAHMTPVAIADVAAAMAAILLHPNSHLGRTYSITSGRHTLAQLADAFSDALGVEIKYVQVPYEAALEATVAAGMPRWQAEGVMELNRMIDADHPRTNLADSLNDLTLITGRKPMPMRAWVESEINAFR